MKRKIKNILSAVTIGACVAANMTSCESYLDVDSYFYDQNTIDSVFQSKVLVNEYINGIATYLPDESKLFTESPFPFGWLLMNVLLPGRMAVMLVCISCWVMKQPRPNTLIIGHIITRESEKRIFCFQELVNVRTCLIWNEEITPVEDIS